MNSRRQKRQILREGLDQLRAKVSATDKAPQCDLVLLTAAERGAYDVLMEKYDAALEFPYSQLSDDELLTLCALSRKAHDVLIPTEIYSHSPQDYHDTKILKSINAPGYRHDENHRQVD